jgi:hypothetical protein
MSLIFMVVVNFRSLFPRKGSLRRNVIYVERKEAESETTLIYRRRLCKCERCTVRLEKNELYLTGWKPERTRESPAVECIFIRRTRSRYRNLDFSRSACLLRDDQKYEMPSLLRPVRYATAVACEKTWASKRKNKETKN